MKTLPKPLLLLDVDGVLCPLGPGPGCAMSALPADDYLVRYRSDLPLLLARLAGSFELVWATAWETSANDCLAPTFDLPALRVVEFSAHADLATDTACSTWKLPAVQAFVGQRACAWVDDVLGHDAHDWAAARQAPTLLIDVPADIGLTDEHVELLLAFARRQRQPAGADASATRSAR